MRWALPVIFNSLLCACVSPDLSQRIEASSYPSHAFRGRYEHLEALVAAGKACGYADMEILLETPHATPVVRLEVPAGRDVRFECVIQWIGAHPETGFRTGM